MQWPVSLNREPRANEVAGSTGIIDETGSVVQSRMVVHELDIADRKFHTGVNGRVVSDGVEGVERSDLSSRRDGGFGEPCGRVDVLTLIHHR